MNGHSVFDVVAGQRLVVLHDLSGEDQAKLLQRSVPELGSDLQLELKITAAILKARKLSREIPGRLGTSFPHKMLRLCSFESILARKARI